MRQVIDGKVYDTEKAEKIDSYRSGAAGDLSAITESLYKTQKGTYFLAGSGGPMTRYARRIDNNSTCGGSGITPLSKQEALAWCEEHGTDAEIIEKEFADLVQEA